MLGFKINNQKFVVKRAVQGTVLSILDKNKTTESIHAATSTVITMTTTNRGA